MLHFMKIIIILLIVIILNIIKIYKEYFTNQYKQNGGQMLNIYNEPLSKCSLTSGETGGSWDSDGKCSELNGGVHQICGENISDNTPGFSSKTGQSNWSDTARQDKNHCVCLGAWSLYNASQNTKSKKVLKCSDDLVNLS